MSSREAWQYLRERMGAAVPTFQSWKSYMIPSRIAAGRAPQGLPPPLRLPGHKRLLFRRADLDAWIARTRREAAAQVASQTGE